MATTMAALKGKFGSTSYYILSMRAKELVEKAIIPSEMEEWQNMTLEEREQRDINYTRVKTQIAPYLAKDKDRFFGAIIVTARNFNENNFEPIADVATRGLPKLYKSQAQLMGFLTFDGGELLIPLDGQHRLKALKFAMEGYDEKQKKLNFAPSRSLAEELVTVILIPYNAKKSRKIFTKVNRYAKPTTTGQNLVTDDDDIIAVLSRKIANDVSLIGPDLVKYTSNTLSDREGYFTTLATIAECNVAILNACFGENINRQMLPDDDKSAEYSRKVEEVWRHLLENISEFSDMLEDKGTDGNARRQEIRMDFLLGKPVPQVCLVTTFACLVHLPKGDNFSYSEASDKLNQIDWSKDALLWDRLLMTGTKIITKNAKITVDILLYMLGAPHDSEQEETLLKRYKALFPEAERAKVKLPDKI